MYYNMGSGMTVNEFHITEEGNLLAYYYDEEGHMAIKDLGSPTFSINDQGHLLADYDNPYDPNTP